MSSNLIIVPKYFIICILYTVDFNVTCIESFVVVWSSSVIKALLFVLYLSLHYSTSCDDVSRDTSVNQIISQFTVNCFWHFSCIHILDVIIYFLKSDSLKETCLCCVFLSNKESWVALLLRTFVRLCPFPINKVDLNFLFTIVTFKHNAFDKHSNGANS